MVIEWHRINGLIVRPKSILIKSEGGKWDKKLEAALRRMELGMGKKRGKMEIEEGNETEKRGKQKKRKTEML